MPGQLGQQDGRGRLLSISASSETAPRRQMLYDPSAGQRPSFDSLLAIVDQDENVRAREPGDWIIIRTMTFLLHRDKGIGKGQDADRKDFRSRGFAGVPGDPVFEGTIHLDPCSVAARVPGSHKEIGAFSRKAMKQGVVRRAHTALQIGLAWFFRAGLRKPACRGDQIIRHGQLAIFCCSLK